jgi:predicted nucleic acid-binding protein
VIFLLDACALLAFINEEKGKGFEKVDELLTRAEAGEITLFMSAVNLVEVHYDLIRNGGQKTANMIMQSIEALPFAVLDYISPVIRQDAARMKARYAMSLADTFLCATAKSLSATIVTKDSEIEEAEKAEPLSIIWIS